MVAVLIGLLVASACYSQGLTVMKSQFIFSWEDGNCYAFTNSWVPVGMPNVVIWGSQAIVSNSMPADLTNATVVSTGFDHCVALRDDGSVVSWGFNQKGQTNTPVLALPATQVAAGKYWSSAVLTDGSVVWWGLAPTSYIPLGGLSNVNQVQQAGTNAIVLDSYGNVTVLDDKVVSPIIGNAIAVAGESHRYGAVLADGTVRMWGQKGTNYPSNATNAWGIAIGAINTIVGRNDGSAVWWGTNGVSTGNLATEVTSITAGSGTGVSMVQSNQVAGYGGTGIFPSMAPAFNISGQFGYRAAVLMHY